MSSHLALIIWDWWEGHCSICSVCHCFDNSSVCFLQDKAVFTCFKSFTFKNFFRTKSNGCVTCWGVDIIEGCAISCTIAAVLNRCVQFAFFIICYSYFSCDCLRIVGNSIFSCSSFHFLDGVSVSAFFIKWQFFKLNFSVCTILRCFNVTSLVCQGELELIFLSSCLTTCQLLSHFKNSFGIFSLIGVFESAVVIIISNSCFKRSLTVVNNFNRYFDSLVSISDTVLSLTSFVFVDCILVNTSFLEF